MKKLVSALLALVLVLSLSAALASEGMMTGGWEIVPAEGAVLPDEAVAALEKAVEKLDGASYVPVTLLATQIVAGTNYCILCQVTPVVPDAKPAWALVYIYADLEGNASISNVYELYIDKHVYPPESEE